MLSRIREKIEELKKMQKPAERPAVAASDPVAAATEWTPLKAGGANFQTHRLEVVSAQYLRFKASLGALLFYGLFFLIGTGMLTGFSVHHTLAGTWELSVDIVLPLLMGLVFASVGGGLLYWGTKPIQFDKQTGYFWKGRTSPSDVFNVEELSCAARLTDIHAIQLLREYVQGQKGGGYYSYEMNLILKDSHRLNVVDHGKLEKARADAQQLADFLHVPLWDATQG